MELRCGEWSGAHDPGTLCRQVRACRARRSVRSTSPSINSSFCCFTGGPGTLLLQRRHRRPVRHARSCRTGYAAMLGPSGRAAGSAARLSGRQQSSSAALVIRPRVWNWSA